MRKLALAVAILLAGALCLPAQPPPAEPLPEPAVRIEVASPGGAILSFRPRGRTTVDFAGTGSAPQAYGFARVENRGGYLEVEIGRGDLRGLEPASHGGPDYLTYVLWAVPMGGAAMNLGELILLDGRNEALKASAPYQTFWLMVTAEPDFAVQEPSPAAVLVSQNQDQTRTGNKAVAVPGALVYYSHYTDYSTSGSAPAPVALRELLQARKAMELATRKGFLSRYIEAAPDAPAHEKQAREVLYQARAYFDEAEKQFQAGGDVQIVTQYAQTATQLAENARALAYGATGDGPLKRLLGEIDALRASEAQARQQLSDAQREVTSLQDRLSQLEGSLDLERRRTRELEGQLLAIRERLSLLEGNLEGAREDTARLRGQRGRLCEDLRRQLAALGRLVERDDGVVLTLSSDLLFEFNRYDLKPAARESLARLAVLRLLLFPGADIHFEGHTDLAGEEDYNQWLSEQRALSVFRFFLEEQIAGARLPDERAEAESRLARVEQLLAMNSNTARREAARRKELLDALGDVIVGKGMREPLVPERGANEENRRVNLIFPETTAAGLYTVCPAVSPAP
ncbi:MAG: OmpA family protein [Candidatus Acidiferrales bacterium]